jgi:hypothetical protein
MHVPTDIRKDMFTISVRGVMSLRMRFSLTGRSGNGLDPSYLNCGGLSVRAF